MSFSHEYDLPVVVSTGSVLTTGYTADLKAGQFAFANAKSLSLISGAPADPQTKILFASGSWHTKDKLDRYRGGMLRSDKSTEFLAKDIIAFERSMPLKAKSEEWILGWDGVSSESLHFDCDTQYRFLVEVKGEGVYGTFLRPLVREIGFKTDCCPGDNCTDTCDDSIPGLKYAKEIAKQINTDPELKYFLQAEAIWDSATTHSATHSLWHLTIPDDGTQMALAQVQVSTTYPVTRSSRTGIYSTYEIAVPVGSADPSAFTPVAPYVLAECSTCDAGYTLTSPGTEAYIVRPLAGTEDLSSPSAKQTYADAIGLAYFPAVTFNAATAANTNDTFTINAHGFSTGNKVKYDANGGTAITGITTLTSYYVIKTGVNTFKLATSYANALAGTAIDITVVGVGTQKFIPQVSPTFSISNGATATTKVIVPAGKTATPLLSDTVVSGATVSEMCTATSPTPVSWIVGLGRYKVSRTLNITLEKECNSQNRLAALQAAYANQPDLASGIVLLTAGTCSDVYSVTQYNKELLKDGCLSEGVASYDSLPSFEGHVWTEVPASDSSTTGTKVGVRVTAAYEDTKFGGCSFNPSDYYSARPLRMEITALVNGPGLMQDEITGVCVAPIPSRKTRFGQMSTQTGDWLIRKLIAADRYKVHGEFYHDPRLREVMDAQHLRIVDTKANYVAYFLKFKQDRSNQNHTGDFSPEIWEAIIAFPVGTNTAAFESLVQTVAAPAKVFLKDR